MLTLEQTLDDAVRFAVDTFNNRGEVLPMFVADGDERLVIATPWGNNEEKDLVMRQMRAVFALKNVKQFAFMTEANSLADHPDRREVLIVRAEDKQRSLQKVFFILRPEHGPAKLKEAAEFSEPVDGESGRMVGLLR